MSTTATQMKTTIPRHDRWTQGHPPASGTYWFCVPYVKDREGQPQVYFGTYCRPDGAARLAGYRTCESAELKTLFFRPADVPRMPQAVRTATLRQRKAMSPKVSI